MPSIADGQFPRFVWRDGKRRLWNPIYRKALVNRPEERVRLRIIEYLLDTGWSKYRISTEEKLGDEPTRSPLRTDIICYSGSFDPEILIECKAEEVNISEEAALQTARYNRTVGAPYLLLTNGRRDFWYQIEEDTVSSLARPPDRLDKESKKIDRSFRYWSERGFAGKQAGPGLREWLESALSNFWTGPGIETRYLEFDSRPTGIPLSHYYGIRKFQHEQLAVSFISTPAGDSNLYAVLNRDGQNTGLIEIHLDQLEERTGDSGLIFTERKQESFDAEKECELDLRKPPGEDIDELPSKLLTIFKKSY